MCDCCQVAVGYNHVTAVSNERMVYTWGEGGNGQLGHGTQESLLLPEVVQVLKGKSIVRYVGHFLGCVSIIIFIIKDTHPSGRNGMLRSVSDRIDGGARASVCGRSGRVWQACVFFSAIHLLYRRGRGRGRGRVGWMFRCSCWSASS